MTRCLILALTLLPWLSPVAMAGPWPRATGEGFLALSGQTEGPDDFGFYRQSASLYSEYGLTDRLTLGLDLNGDTLRMSKAIVFLRWPAGPPERALKLAVELGAGVVEEEAALRPGLSLGRGISLAGRQGWLALDTRVALRGGGKTTYESDATFGVSTGARTKLILQIQSGLSDGGTGYARFAPSLVYEIRSGQHVELGLIAPISGEGENGFRLGLWRQF